MDQRVAEINKLIKRHDSELFCQREINGAIHIYRKGKQVESYSFNGNIFSYVREVPHFILALTHNWSVSGVPIDWGLEPIYLRLQEIDCWNRPDFMEKLLTSYEKAKESKDRKRQTDIEAFLSDNRRVFQRAFNDINVAGMDKTKLSVNAQRREKWV